MPTLRHVRGFGTAFAGTPSSVVGEPATLAEWVSHLVDLAEGARLGVRTKDVTDG
jgi:hypothetical protein